CWRLASDLAGRGHQVRLVIDDPAPLQLIAPAGARGVDVQPWPQSWPSHLRGPGDVVVEAFGCDPPAEFVEAMVARAPLWLNLEYLSAEAYVERSHGLPSPQPNGLTKTFFFPGFTARTGGLLREPELSSERVAFDRTAWLARNGIHPQPGERLVSLFCYDNAALPRLLQSLGEEPTLLVLTPGPAQQQVVRPVGALRLHRLGWFSQPEFDRLLWACDINFVRGEDSLVRALWAGAPLAWQLYPQHDGAHLAKLEALLAAMNAPAGVAAFWRAWNGAPGAAWPGLPPPAAWRACIERWREALLAQDDLCTQLLAWVGHQAARQRC
ncbi:MAG TPA: elongation factor P maturation arginine rhamnosyltransferase EarP, partial [Rubrivivax sp.]|nr:elongation factor P maturation arginine rhamnosyltransferase EarP [Rubrivivax sp.]